MKKYLVDKKGTYVIGISKNWLDKNGVFKQNQDFIKDRTKYYVDYKEFDDSILISPHSTTSPAREVGEKSVVINADMIPKSVKRYIAAFYRTGYTKITVNFSDKKIMRTIEEIKDTLIGLSIINEKPTSCDISIHIDLGDVDFKNAIKRAFLVLHRMTEHTLNAAKENNISEFRRLVDYDRQLNQQTNLCERTLIQRKFSDVQRIPFYYYLSKQVEKLGDEYSNICQDYLKGKKLTSAELKILQEINNLIVEFTTAYTLFDPERVEKLDQDLRKFWKTLKNIHLSNIVTILLNSISEIYTSNI